MGLWIGQEIEKARRAAAGSRRLSRELALAPDPIKSLRGVLPHGRARELELALRRARLVLGRAQLERLARSVLWRHPAWTAARIIVELARMLARQEREGLAHWPTVWGGGFRVCAECSMIGRYPPNWVYGVIGCGSGHGCTGSTLNFVKGCLANQGDTANKTVTASHCGFVESHRYWAGTVYRHRLVRQWGRPASATSRPFVWNGHGVFTWVPQLYPREAAAVVGAAASRPVQRGGYEEWFANELVGGLERTPRVVDVGWIGPVGPQPAVSVELEARPDGVIIHPPRPDEQLDVPPPRGERERKAKLTRKGLSALRWLVQRGVNPFSEILDVVDALYQALPRELRQARTAHQRIIAVVENWWRIDLEEAIEGLILNQLEDYIFGRLSRGVAHLRGRIPIGGTAGPAL